jgi:hypothetical protein
MSKHWPIQKNVSNKAIFNLCRTSCHSNLYICQCSSIVKVRETRLTALISHIFIGMSLFMCGILQQIPMPVLDGLFLYLALTSLDGNQFFERVTLFFTEQVKWSTWIHHQSYRHLFSYFSRLPIHPIIIFVKCRNVKFICLHSYNWYSSLYFVYWVSLLYSTRN